MYVGIDVGGTKTLIAALNADGVIVEQDRFPTPKKYDEYLDQITTVLSHFTHRKFQAGGIGIAANLDRKKGLIVNMGNLPWVNKSIQYDLEKICQCPIIVENDAKMGGLSEARLLKNDYSKVLYVAIGTGIGFALIADQVIDTSVGDGGGRSLLLDHRGKLMPWEDFAGGRALKERYGKPASEITDPKAWQTISRYLAQGLVQLIAIAEPDVIVVGGGVGAYFDQFKQFLSEELDKYALPMLKMPVSIIKAQRPEKAVVYGCYDLAKAEFKQ